MTARVLLQAMSVSRRSPERSSPQRTACGDFVVRYGGEEFAGILPETPEAGALKVGERIVSAVRDLAIPHAATQRVPSGIVTVSIGCATTIPSSSPSPLSSCTERTRPFMPRRTGEETA